MKTFLTWLTEIAEPQQNLVAQTQATNKIAGEIAKDPQTTDLKVKMSQGAPVKPLVSQVFKTTSDKFNQMDKKSPGLTTNTNVADVSKQLLTQFMGQNAAKAAMPNNFKNEI